MELNDDQDDGEGGKARMLRMLRMRPADLPSMKVM